MNAVTQRLDELDQAVRAMRSAAGRVDTGRCLPAEAVSHLKEALEAVERARVALRRATIRR